MKKPFRALLVVAWLVPAACGPSRDKEPNDGFESATPIVAGRVEGTLSSAADVDYFRIDVKEDGVLAAHVGGIRDVDFSLAVYGKDRQELKRFDETTVGGDEFVTDIGVKPGAYFLVLSNKNAKADNSSQKYQLEVRLLRGPGREQEPDDSPQTASLLEIPGVTRGHYFPTRNLLAGDTDYQESDWYRVNIAQEGLFLLNLDLSEVSKVDPILEIYDMNFYKVKEVDSSGVGEGESLKNFGVRGPAQFLMRLRAKNGSANAETPYEILAELIPYQGKTEFEPNDQRVDATPFSQASVSGTIAPEGDRDWYKVSVTEDARQILRASVSGVEGMDIELQAADSLGNPIMTVDSVGKGQPEVLTGLGVSKGDYYLIVSEKSGRKSDGKRSYELAKSVIPFQSGLEYEINDTTSSIQQIKVGEAVDGYFAPRGDVDYYEFNAYQKGVVIVEMAGVFNVQPLIALIDQEGNELQNWAAVKAGDSLTFERELEAGTYALRVKAVKDDQNNVRDKYSLRLRVR